MKKLYEAYLDDRHQMVIHKEYIGYSWALFRDYGHTIATSQYDSETPTDAILGACRGYVIHVMLADQIDALVKTLKPVDRYAKVAPTESHETGANTPVAPASGVYPHETAPIRGVDVLALADGIFPDNLLAWAYLLAVSPDNIRDVLIAELRARAGDDAQGIIEHAELIKGGISR